MLIALAVVVAVGCANFKETSPSSHHSAPASECRMVQHKLGETCVPSKPRRIISLDPAFVLDPLLALGIRPIGTSVDDWQGQRYWGGLSLDEVQGIEVIGQLYQPSLEKIASLDPDLILGIDSVAQYYGQLSAIAPTVLFDYENEVKWSFKDHLKSIAQIVGQEHKVKDALNDYYNRVEELRDLTEDVLEGGEISVVTYSGDTLWAPAYYAVFFQVLKRVRSSHLAGSI